MREEASIYWIINGNYWKVFVLCAFFCFGKNKGIDEKLFCDTRGIYWILLAYVRNIVVYLLNIFVRRADVGYFFSVAVQFFERSHLLSVIRVFDLSRSFCVCFRKRRILFGHNIIFSKLISISSDFSRIYMLY